MSDMHSLSQNLNTRNHVHLKEFVFITVILSGALLIWELAVILTNTPPYLLPRPSLIFSTLWQQRWYYFQSSLVTFAEAMAGLFAGMIVGILSAVVITLWHKLERATLILAILVKATPMVAISPLLIIWFGFGALPKIIITGLITFFPVLINVHAGFHSTDDAILALMHSLNASRWEILLHARWPTAIPYLFAALKVIGPLSFVGAVVAEWAGASVGLGRAMWLAYTNLNMPVLFAAIICSAVMGIGIYLFINFLEHRIIFWQ